MEESRVLLGLSEQGELVVYVPGLILEYGGDRSEQSADHCNEWKTHDSVHRLAMIIISTSLQLRWQPNVNFAMRRQLPALASPSLHMPGKRKKGRAFRHTFCSS